MHRSEATPGARFRRVALALIALCALALVATAGADEPKTPTTGGGILMMPPNYSDLGESIDLLFYWILWLTTIIFIGVQGALIWFLIKYRERKDRPQRIVYSHGDNRLEAIWTAIPALICIVLAFASENLWSQARKNPPKDPLEVHVVAKQFAWNFIYAGADGLWDTKDDVQSGKLVLKRGMAVRFHIHSEDVLHSFFLPNFRMKQDAMPGAWVQTWITPTRAGVFEVVCAEFCGLEHGQMRAILEVMEPDAYDAWWTAQSAKSAAGPVSYE